MYIQLVFYYYLRWNSKERETNSEKTLITKCSKLRVHPAPCVHILAAGCTDVGTCAPGMCMFSITYL